jgi:hypothetical protein
MAMHRRTFVFAQVMAHRPQPALRRCVAAHDGE